MTYGAEALNMLRLIKRCPEYAAGYREYCREAYDSGVGFLIPTDPAVIDGGWFGRTKEWYDKEETGQVPWQPRGFHYWAIDGGEFIGEFQLRTELSEQVLSGIGSVGYAVRVSRQGMGYGTELLRQGLAIAKEHGMDRVVLNISAANTVSAHVCQKLGGRLIDSIHVVDRGEGDHIILRYGISLQTARQCVQ